MREKERKYCYGMYTLLFLMMSMAAFLPFFMQGKSFVWGAGVEDGLSQHFSALAYYGELLREFVKNLIAGHPKLTMWNMSLGYGADVIATLNYYAIGDPLNLLYGFIPVKYTEIMYNFMILFRMYLAGIAFILYARKMRKRTYGTVIGALVYVFCGFCFRLGLRHPFFLNPMIYFPLLCLGIEKIYQKQKPYLFIVMICVSAISNYYFFYMLTIFSVIYAWIRFYKYTEKDRIKNFFLTILKFGGYYVLGICMAAVILIPSVIGFLGNGRYGSGTDWRTLLIYPGKYYLMFLENFVGYGNVGSNTNTGYLPIVGIVVLFTLFSKRMKHKKYCLAFLGSVVALIFPIFGYVFNGLSYANNRWAFVLSFIVALLTAEMYPRLFIMTKRQKIGIGAGIGLYIILCMVISVSGGKMLKNPGIMAACIMMVVFYAAFLIFQKMEYDSRTRSARIVTVVLLLISVGIHGYYRFNTDQYAYANEFLNQGTALKELRTENITMLKNVKDSSLYRVHAEGYRYKNYGLINDLNTISGYYSITPKCVTDTVNSYETLGMQYADKYKGLDQRIGLLSLSGVKYMTIPKEKKIGKDQITAADVPYGMKKVKQNGDITLYKNPYALPFGYGYDSYITQEQYEKLNGVEREQAMLNGVVLNEKTQKNTLNHIKNAKDKNISVTTISDNDISSSKGKKYCKITVPVEKDKETYLYFKNLEYKGKIKVNNKFLLEGKKGTSSILVSDNDVQQKIHIQNPTNPYYFGRKDYMVKLNHHTSKSKETVRLDFQVPGNYEYDDITLITVKKQNTFHKLENLKKYPLKNIEYKENAFKGNFKTDKERMLCITIPYSDGWSAKVDGQNVKIYKANGMFMGILMTPGEHKIELNYMTPGLKMGVVLSLAGWIALAILALLRKKYIIK
ncbi:YfhO family protein [Anaerostipes hadrus]|uniref:YfhO family protein n=1 Tax=Anaerostipes hadrus TaxID=649756 RepID=UPI001C02900B|nr:YfhO family protein [Anaerostipes hadrus]MBT9903641.1 YfhO family protein [Anaerostipes hadrus]